MPADTSPSGGPPRLATALLYLRTPKEVAEAIAGDLEHEYRTSRVPSRGRFGAALWYWGQVLTLRGGRLRRASRRLRAVKPTWERNRPARAQQQPSNPWSRLPMHPRDLKYALRRLSKSPGFTLVAVLSLALGIGANTAMFSLVNAVLIRRAPVVAPEELVEIYTSDSQGEGFGTSSHLDYLALRAQADVFQSVIGTRNFISRVDANGQPKVVIGELISWDYFQTLGVPMALGRSFVEEEDQTPGTHPVTVLGHRTWTQDFGADPAIIGASVYLNGRPYTVVGVAPEEYTGSMPVLVSGLYVPLMMTNVMMRSEQLERRGSRSMFIKARLEPGTTVEQANASLLSISTGLAELYPESNERRVMKAIPSSDVSLHPLIDGMLTPVAGLLLAVVGMVLLIACANLASFLLARAEDRRKEIAVRLALGAGRGTLVSQLLVESTLLSLIGGAAGLVLAQWTIGLLLAFQPPLPIPIDLDISLDRTVLLFTGAVSVLSGIAFGLVPALQATNPDVAPTLKNEGTGSGSPRRMNLRGALVVTQVAFSFLLLIGAGLFVRSMQKAQHIDPGFDTGPGAVVWPMPELSGLETPAEMFAFYEEYEARLLAHPMITKVGFADRLPLGAAVQSAAYTLPGVPSESLDGDHQIDNANVGAGYFAAMGVPMVAGRAFSKADMTGDPVAIVSEAFVSRYYPGEDITGRTIRKGERREFRILGVAADTKVRTLGEAPRPYVYELRSAGGFFSMQVVVRGEGTGSELAAAAHAILKEFSPNMTLFEEPKTMNDHLALLLFPSRMAALLLTVFGGLALLLAGIGIYGVVSYSVSKRTRELGIRMSLGASAGDVVRMAVAGGMRLVGVGAVVGVILAAALTWSIADFLYGIAPTDVGTFIAIPVLLSVVALFAAWIPARRASSVDPVRALRAE